MVKLDQWQQDVLDTKGNICLVSGRQVGKSFIISIKAAIAALSKPRQTIMIVAATERQAYLLFEKTLAFIEQNDSKAIKKGKFRPTKTRLNLRNGSTIHCLPVGLSGYGIRGYTVNQLYVDEAAFVNDDVFTAILPMLSTTKGDLILLSTPHGRKGFLYEASNRTDFKQFRISSEECERHDIEFLNTQKDMMTKKEYAQEYLGHFIDDLDQFFPDKLIKSVMKRQRQPYNPEFHYYMGVDIARMGSDESTFEVVYKKKDRIYQVDNHITKKTLTTNTTRLIKVFKEKFNLKKIYIDSRGVGAGVLDQCLEDNDLKRNIVPIDNAAKDLTYDSSRPKKRKLNKEELYTNLLRLMEQGKIDLLDDSEIFQSLKSVQYEYTNDGDIRIYGKYTHIAEGLIRAAWCVKDKSLNIWIDYI